jgi:hypothetical protein
LPNANTSGTDPLIIAALLGYSHYMDRKANTGKHIAIVAEDASTSA